MDKKGGFGQPAISDEHGVGGFVVPVASVQPEPPAPIAEGGFEQPPLHVEEPPAHVEQE